MASGCAVIAGCTGGLTDLIIPEYNGLLLRPLNTRTLMESFILFDRRSRAETEAEYKRQNRIGILFPGKMETPLA